ncbi:MAG TPA: DUF4339 domain-containing protein [Prosthecobacter sp.]|nr:DUF4339 domain-containing protein [Prosthecobacter sp.]
MKAPEPPLYHIARGEEKYGPYEEHEVRRHLETGRIAPEDLCWREGMGEWERVGERFGPPRGVNNPAPPREPPAAPGRSVLPRVLKGLALSAVTAALIVWGPRALAEMRKALALGVGAWPEVTVPNTCTFQIPPRFEAKVGPHDEMSGVTQTDYQNNILACQATAAPKGEDALSVTGGEELCTVNITSHPRTSTANPADEDPARLDTRLQTEARQRYEQRQAKGVKVKLIEWQGTAVRPVGGLKAVITTEVCATGSGPAKVMHQAEMVNGDRVHKILIQYRQDQAGLWAPAMERVLESFDFERH